jgi:glycosyltransferase involved in cell wall biosynthesis
MLAGFRARDRRVVVLKSPGHGIVDALNAGLAAAKGEFVARMDADDIALPGRLAAQVEAMRAEPTLLALGTAATEIDADGTRQGEIAVATGSAAIRERMQRENPLLHPTVTMRREAVLAVGGYRRALTHAEDYDLWLRLAAREGDRQSG